MLEGCRIFFTVAFLLSVFLLTPDFYFQVFEFGDFTRQLKIDLSGVKINLEYQGREVRQLLGKGDTIGAYGALTTQPCGVQLRALSAFHFSAHASHLPPDGSFENGPSSRDVSGCDDHISH